MFYFSSAYDIIDTELAEFPLVSWTLPQTLSTFLSETGLSLNPEFIYG